MEVYVPGASPAEFMPNDNDPSAPEGSSSQLPVPDLVNVTPGFPVLAESVELSLAVVPFCMTEKSSDVGENDNEGAMTVRVTCRFASA